MWELTHPGFTVLRSSGYQIKLEETVGFEPTRAYCTYLASNETSYSLT